MNTIEEAESALEARIERFRNMLNDQLGTLGYSVYGFKSHPFIRDEVHSRVKLASKYYYKHINSFIKGNVDIIDNKPTNSFKRLSGEAPKILAHKLSQAVRIYNHYHQELSLIHI